MRKSNTKTRPGYVARGSNGNRLEVYAALSMQDEKLGPVAQRTAHYLQYILHVVASTKREVNSLVRCAARTMVAVNEAEKFGRILSFSQKTTISRD